MGDTSLNATATELLGCNVHMLMFYVPSIPSFFLQQMLILNIEYLFSSILLDPHEHTNILKCHEVKKM